MAFKLDTQKLNQILSDLPGDVNKTVRRAAFSVLGNAKRRASVDTGALVNSLAAEEQSQFAWIVRDGVEYGIYQELGTHKMAAHPFMVPAIEAEAKHWEDEWRRLIQ